MFFLKSLLPDRAELFQTFLTCLYQLLVSFAAVFRLVMQRSSPQTAAFFQTTFLSLCLSIQAIHQSYHNHCLNSNQSKCSKNTFPQITIWNVDQRKPVHSVYSSVFETPKKVVEADRCLICSTLVAKKEKLYIFGKSWIDFCEIIKSALNVNVRNFSASEQLFICRAQCYQRLGNLKKAKSELQEVYKATVHRKNRLCKDDPEGDVKISRRTCGKVVKVLHFSEATTCTSSPRASPVALSEGQ